MTDRNRAWRRAQRKKHGGITSTPDPRACWREKKWRLLYLRSAKLKRAQQLGRHWPHREWEQLLDDVQPTNLLFVCSKNQWRSPTGETIFQQYDGVSARSAGTARGARRTISVADIRWADLIFVMEDKHLSRLRAQFRDELRYKKLHVLDIPDLYRFMDPDLIELMRTSVEAVLFADDV